MEMRSFVFIRVLTEISDVFCRMKGDRVLLKIGILGEYGPYPAPGGTTTGLLVQTETGHFLIDIGSGVLAEMTRHISLNDLDALIITHHHHDHVSDLGVLKYAIMVERAQGKRDRPLAVYANGEPKNDFAKVTMKDHVIATPIFADTVLTLCGATVRFAAVNHAIPTLAVAVEKDGKKFVFSADTGPCPEIERLAEGADLFICEASWLIADEGPAEIGHLTTKQAAEIAKKADVKDLCLTHLYPGYHPETIRQEGTQYFGRPVHVAQKGMWFEL
jgi:ribonuclease BN (tRNA processing enzyme)